jgi:hypothetical protein
MLAVNQSSGSGKPKEPQVRRGAGRSSRTSRLRFQSELLAVDLVAIDEAALKVRAAGEYPAEIFSRRADFREPDST